MRLVTPAPDGEAVRQRVDPASVVTDADTARSSTCSCAPASSSPVTTASRWPTRHSSGSGPGCEAGSTRTVTAFASTVTYARRPTGTGRGRDPAELQRGARLAATLDWVEADDAALDDVEAAYLTASTPLEEAELEAARARHAARRPHQPTTATAPGRRRGARGGRSSPGSSPSASATGPTTRPATPKRRPAAPTPRPRTPSATTTGPTARPATPRSRPTDTEREAERADTERDAGRGEAAPRPRHSSSTATTRPSCSRLKGAVWRASGDSVQPARCHPTQPGRRRRDPERDRRLPRPRVHAGWPDADHERIRGTVDLEQVRRHHPRAASLHHRREPRVQRRQSRRPPGGDVERQSHPRRRPVRPGPCRHRDAHRRR